MRHFGSSGKGQSWAPHIQVPAKFGPNWNETMREPKARPLTSIKVLVVDDSSAVRMMLTALLHTFGISSIEVAVNGIQALKMIEQTQFDLVITDVSMEPMDGIEFVRHVRSPSTSGQPALPILILSSHSEAAMLKTAVAAGSTDYLTKPINRAALLSKITSVLDRPRSVVRTDNYWGPERRRSKLGISNRKRRTRD
jgi:two-component system, chemotaxis family, chemotaxis protein CheY